MELKISGGKPQIRIQAAAGILALVFPFAGYPAWTDVSTPSGAVIEYTVDPNTPSTLFATTVGSGAGIWKSTDSGASWGGAAVNTSATFNGVAVQPGNSNVVIAGIQGSGGIERSTDGGNNWASQSTASSSAWHFSFSASNPSVVYAGASDGLNGSDGLILKSTDSGDTWTTQTVDADLTPNVVSIAVDPTNPNIVYAGVKPDGGLNDGLYKTTNGGASWALLGGLNFTTVDALAVDPNDNDIVYAGTSGSDEIWRSIDGGNNWTQILKASNPSTGLGSFNLFAIAVDPDDSRVIYAAGGSAAQVIASSDCGTTWTDVSATGIGFRPDAVRIDTVNNFVYVVENFFLGKLYRETLGNNLPAASGTCPSGTSPGSPPTAVDDSASVDEDNTLVSVTDLDANDTDPDMDPLSVIAGTFATVQGGSIVIASDGSYTYTPPANFNGSDSVNYAVTDGSGSDVGTLNITVNPIDDPPVAVDDAINVVVDTLFNSTVDLDANDIEVDGESLTVTPGTFATAQGGTITISFNGSYSYTPPAGFTGTDSYVYTVTDGISSDTGTLVIDVSTSGGGGSTTTQSIAGDSGDSSASSFGYLLAIFLLPLVFLRAVREKKPKKS